MKAWLSRVAGGPEALELCDVPDPVPGPGQLAAMVLACGLNLPDMLIMEDRYQVKPPRPFAPGAEICGEVTAVGEGVQGWKPGDRLVAVITHGGLAANAVVDASAASRLPAGKDPVEGAAFLLTYATANYALVDRGELRSGETLLVLGAAGGVGLAAVELGKMLGARVVAATSTAAKAAIAREAGADATVIYGGDVLDEPAQRTLAAGLKEAIGPQGADVVCDPVGGSLAEPALRALGFGGRYLVVGFAAGIPRLPMNLALLKCADIRGVYWGAYVGRRPEANRQGMARLLGWWQEGRLRPRIDRTFDLAHAREALRYVAERRAMGKVVVTVA
jgi:NADPH:quinone reductase-like Zn-dependent oxidoreductase